MEWEKPPTDRQAKYLERRHAGDNPTTAAAVAGFAQPYFAGRRLERHPGIIKALERLRAGGTLMTPAIREPIARAEAIALLTQIARDETAQPVSRISALKTIGDMEKWTEGGVHVGVQLVFGKTEADL